MPSSSIGMEFFNSDKETDLIQLTPDGNSITGRFLKSPHLKIFSTKFYKALKKINRLNCLTNKELDKWLDKISASEQSQTMELVIL